MAFTWEKQRGLYQSKVNSSLACIHGQVTKHTTVKWPIVSYFMLVAGEETESAGKKRFGRNRISAEIPLLERTVTAVPFLFACFLCLVMLETNVPQIGTIVNFLDESKRCLTFVKSVRHFGKCHANRVNRARVFIGWQLPKHVCQSFTRQIRVYQHEKVGE